MRLIIYLSLTLLFSCSSVELANLSQMLVTSKDPRAQTLGHFVNSKREITPEEELTIGNTIGGGLLTMTPLMNNAEAQNYVNDLGMWIALQSEQPSLAWRFGIIDTDDYNAFSMPGGIILISRGVVKNCATEAELAGVLAHEISHVLKKHHVKALQQEAQRLGLSQLSDEISKGSKNKETAALASSVVKAGSSLYAKGLDKDDEFEADRMGVVLAVRAGYSSAGLVRVLDGLSHQNAKTDKYSLLFKTHPSPESRIENLNKGMSLAVKNYSYLNNQSSRFSFVKKMM
ncbi:MAG: M48 family metallopeptidase [Pseudobdellovibrio sp.]